MPADITLGDNYQIDENSNGNLVIIDSSGNPVLEHTDGGGWSINTTADINDLTDSASGNTVYDSSTETFGDGNQDGNFNSVSTGEVLLSENGSIQNSADAGNFYKQTSHSLADTEKAQLINGDPLPEGFAIVVVQDGGQPGYVGTFQVRGDNNSVTEISDPTGQMTTAEGNDLNINVYYDPGNNRVEINNERGAPRTISVHLFS